MSTDLLVVAHVRIAPSTAVQATSGANAAFFMADSFVANALHWEPDGIHFPVW